MRGLEYHSIISELESLFPEFANNSELKEIADNLPSIYLTFLIDYVCSNWGDLAIQIRLAKLMNDLGRSKDRSTEIVFSDFALDFYLHFKEHEVNIDTFLNSLLPSTKKHIEYCVDFWHKANTD